jgi:hypothetical protein
MPASRSRTDRWKDSLWRIYERGGGLEFTIQRPDDSAAESKDLIWRVHVLDLNESEITVEQPGAMGVSFEIEDGTPLVGILAVGQNKWMFHTTVLGHTRVKTRNGGVPALRVKMPEKVERCLRRNFDRISTAQVSMPNVECWRLLNPQSAVPYEVSNQVQTLDLIETGGVVSASDDPAALPEVGPKFKAVLSNVGGGGVGLIVDKEHRSYIDSGKVFWMRLDLRPVVPAPLVLTARLAHTHIDSQQNTYAGFAFDFSLNQRHKHFVVGQIARFIKAMQSPINRAA